MSKEERMGNEEKKVSNEATRIEKPMEQYSLTCRHRYGLTLVFLVNIDNGAMKKQPYSNMSSNATACGRVRKTLIEFLIEF